MVKQRVREKRNKSESSAGDEDAEGDLLKNGVVKHSTHIVSHLFSPPAPYVFPHNALAHIFAFQPFPPPARRFYSCERKGRGTNGSGVRESEGDADF